MGNNLKFVLVGKCQFTAGPGALQHPDIASRHGFHMLAIGQRREHLGLVENAIRHSPPGGTVWIRCEREGNIAAVIVADAGEGVSPEHQERIFDRFERLGLRDGTGSGLGLYISRRLARAMGGDLGIDSALGKGARFVFTLPVDE